tara:strand:- start:49 stop:291 length:243 start_codon:yes stop_codon:yes gene_type:complete
MSGLALPHKRVGGIDQLSSPSDYLDDDYQDWVTSSRVDWGTPSPEKRRDESHEETKHDKNDTAQQHPFQQDGHLCSPGQF